MVAAAKERGETAAVTFITSADDSAFVARLRAGDRVAIGALFDRHADRIERVLYRVLGVDAEIPDLLQDVFVYAMTGIAKYRGDDGNLAAWLTQIAVAVARKCIRRRVTRRFLGLRTPGELPDWPGTEDPEMQTVLRRAYAVLERLPARERIPFALRHLEGMQLVEVAEACDTSLATTKRRLSAARVRFERLAARDPLLCEWLREEASA
jgi:RNA polymerase sigma-70 factor (ECF subfamily)